MFMLNTKLKKTCKNCTIDLACVCVFIRKKTEFQLKRYHFFIFMLTREIFLDILITEEEQKMLSARRKHDIHRHFLRGYEQKKRSIFTGSAFRQNLIVEVMYHVHERH